MKLMQTKNLCIMICLIFIFNRHSNAAMTEATHQYVQNNFDEFIEAIKYNYKELAYDILLTSKRAGLLKELVLRKTNNGFSLLHKAVHTNRYDLVRYLSTEASYVRCDHDMFLDQATNPRFPNYTALHMAEDCGIYDIVHFLLVAARYAGCLPAMLRSATNNGSTVLHIAAEKGHESSLALLLMTCKSTLTTKNPQLFLSEMLTLTNHQNQTAYDVAVARNKVQCAHLLNIAAMKHINRKVKIRSIITKKSK